LSLPVATVPCVDDWLLGSVNLINKLTGLGNIQLSGKTKNLYNRWDYTLGNSELADGNIFYN
jgi:hypothetical protein